MGQTIKDVMADAIFEELGEEWMHFNQLWGRVSKTSFEKVKHTEWFSKWLLDHFGENRLEKYIDRYGVRRANDILMEEARILWANNTARYCFFALKEMEKNGVIAAKEKYDKQWMNDFAAVSTYGVVGRDYIRSSNLQITDVKEYKARNPIEIAKIRIEEAKHNKRPDTVLDALRKIGEKNDR